MRTQDEIIAKIELLKEDKTDVFGFKRTDLIYYLEFEHAETYFDKIDKKDWEPNKTTVEAIKERMIEYMDFAWDKANNFRGLSAGRTMQHYQVWLWMLGAEEFADSLDGYNYYGKPNLVEICKFLDLDSNKWDDGVRSNTEPGCTDEDYVDA